jgi:hypothetical protein
MSMPRTETSVVPDVAEIAGRGWLPEKHPRTFANTAPAWLPKNGKQAQHLMTVVQKMTQGLPAAAASGRYLPANIRHLMATAQAIRVIAAAFGIRHNGRMAPPETLARLVEGYLDIVTTGFAETLEMDLTGTGKQPTPVAAARRRPREATKKDGTAVVEDAAAAAAVAAATTAATKPADGPRAPSDAACLSPLVKLLRLFAIQPEFAGILATASSAGRQLEPLTGVAVAVGADPTIASNRALIMSMPAETWMACLRRLLSMTVGLYSLDDLCAFATGLTERDFEAPAAHVPSPVESVACEGDDRLATDFSADAITAALGPVDAAPVLAETPGDDAAPAATNPMLAETQPAE